MELDNKSVKIDSERGNTRMFPCVLKELQKQGLGKKLTRKRQKHKEASWRFQCKMGAGILG
jgi:hypothetical protein